MMNGKIQIPDVKRSADSFFCTCPEADYSYVVKKENRHGLGS